MRILYLDLDTLRPDHLGCYGYHRDTSPNIDAVANRGARCENYYVSDAPCLPSRAALFTGRFGIHNGCVGHGGTAADMRIQGASRGFRSAASWTSWVSMFRKAGFHTVSVSPFAERHSAWWFYTMVNEMYNTGRGGLERADEIAPLAHDWISRNAKRDNWFLQVNFWDPHTPYRTPMEYGNPFEDSPPPGWLTEEMIQAHRASYGPHSAQEPLDFDEPEKCPWPRIPTQIRDLADWKRWIDGYDVGIRYMDDHIGRILNQLADEGVLDDTAIMISSDHGENQGELNVYGDHQTADHICSRVPFIARWPGMKSGLVDRELHYQVDLPPTTAELLGAEAPPIWDGKSFASTIRDGKPCGRDYLVVSQCVWSCQRAVRWGPWVMIRTFHDGFKDFPPFMLFNIEDDPHETVNLAEKRADVLREGLSLLENWTTEMMTSADSPEDPLWRVMREGGPHHTVGVLDRYARRLRATGRAHIAEKLEAQYGRE